MYAFLFKNLKNLSTHFIQHIKHFKIILATLLPLFSHCFSIYIRITCIILHTAIINDPNNSVPKWYLKHQQNALHETHFKLPLSSFLVKNQIDTASALIICPIATINAPTQKYTNICPNNDYLNSELNEKVLANPPGAFGTFNSSIFPAESVNIANRTKIPVTTHAAANCINGTIIKPHNWPIALADILTTYVAVLIRLQLQITYNIYINSNNPHKHNITKYAQFSLLKHEISSNGGVLVLLHSGFSLYVLSSSL